jgi:hypothetical protein
MAPTIPFPGWDHPQLMDHFQQHMKSQGWDNPAILNQFVQNRKLMMDSSGKHIPFAGVKRITDDTLSKARGKAKKPKTVRKTSKSSDNAIKTLQTDDGHRDSEDNLSSGTMFAFIVFVHS